MISNKKVLWFSGLSGSGKTTIANALKNKLESLGKNVVIIDADDVREKRDKPIGFSRDDIRENNRHIAQLAKEKISEYDFVIVPIISPYQEDRAMVRKIIGENFMLVHINASVGTCIKRDTKGMYKKTLEGEMDNLIGMSEKNPYETPEDHGIEVCTDKVDPDKNVKEILHFLGLV